jgi:fructosamine-3-kinase
MAAYPQAMLRPEDVQIDPAVATAIIRRHMDPDLNVVQVRRLHGGMVNYVLEFITDSQPASVVAKVTPHPDEQDIFAEASSLRFCMENTEFPVPQVYACFSGCETFTGTCLLMEKIEGHNLAESRITPRGKDFFQQDLARHVAMLHNHRRATYGPALGDGHHNSWIDRFGPTFEAQFTAVREQLPTATRHSIEKLIQQLDVWLPDPGKPTLIHGDIWATNILVDDAHPDRPEILAFIDGQMAYADPEYELAYLRLFNTASPIFFEHYHKVHPMRRSFERRCRVYWLHTMLLHVRMFGPRYINACDQIVAQLRLLGPI